MSEIAEATQVVALAGSALSAAVRGFYRLTELGVQLFKALKGNAEKRAHERLFGEVTLEQLSRFEGTKLSTARFENLTMEELKPKLDSYGIPYVVMPDSEVNGIRYTSVTFGNTYTDRMAAVIQDFAGKGVIVRENAVPKYIMSGEVSLEVLQEQDGPDLKIFQFPEETMGKILPVLNRAGIKYAVLPDLNLGDGLSEIAFSPSQRELVQRTMARMVNGKIMEMEEYYANASPEELEKLADEYDQTHSTLKDRQENGAAHLILDGEDYARQGETLVITIPEVPYDFEIPKDALVSDDGKRVTLAVLPGDILIGHRKNVVEPEKVEAKDQAESFPETIEIRGEDFLSDVGVLLDERRAMALAGKEDKKRQVKERTEELTAHIAQAVETAMQKSVNTVKDSPNIGPVI